MRSTICLTKTINRCRCHSSAIFVPLVPRSHSQRRFHSVEFTLMPQAGVRSYPKCALRCGCSCKLHIQYLVLLYIKYNHPRQVDSIHCCEQSRLSPIFSAILLDTSDRSRSTSFLNALACARRAAASKPSLSSAAAPVGRRPKRTDIFGSFPSTSSLQI